MKLYLEVLILLIFIDPLNAETLTFKSGELAAVGISTEVGSGTLIKSNNQIKKIIAFPFVANDQTFTDKDIEGTMRVEYINFGESRITITDISKVNLSASDQQRANREALLIREALSKNDSTLTPSFQFMRPVAGIVTSPYGKQRYINGQKRSVHLALDMNGKTGDPIIAPLKGRVVLTGNFFYTGNTVILNHGEGLYTSYAHMDEITADFGKIIQQGNQIGTVGATGRVTGPHLHWTVYFNGNKINPEWLIEEDFLKTLLQ